MTQQFTKEDYQAALKKVDDFKFQCGQAAQYHIENSDEISYNSCLDQNYIYDTIKSALQLAIAAQPRPIEEAPKNGEQFLVTDGECVVMAEWSNDEIDIFDCTCHVVFSDKTRATHFYDLSFLPKPKERKDLYE